MPPKPAFPKPAAVLPGEADILANVIANLADHDAKLVYADWLEERNDPRGPQLRKFMTAHQAEKKLPGVKSTPKPWRDLVGITLIEKLRDTELAPKMDRLLALAKPAIGFKTTRATEKTLPLGSSKLGGLPDMPAEMKWPRWKDKPHLFLGQLNLAELSQSGICRELPETGVLSIFYGGDNTVFDNSDKGGWRIFHFPDISALVRREVSDELLEEIDTVFTPCRVNYSEVLTLPGVWSPWSTQLSLETDKEHDTYQNFLAGLASSQHRLLGYADPLETDVHGRKDVRHLLTIGSDRGPGWMWGDSGSLYFTITDKNLQTARFDRVRFEMQCC